MKQRRLLFGVRALRPSCTGEKVDHKGGFLELFQAIGAAALDVVQDTRVLFRGESTEKKQFVDLV
jgi:hypothetical protein